MTTLVDFIDDRFAGIDIDSLLNGERRPLSYERKKALYEAPEFIQRLSGEETVMEGQSLCIECRIRGFPVPSVRWFKDDEEIIDHHRIHIQSNGIGGYFLVIDNVTRDDEAAYRCRAENLEGACSSFFFLSVKGKPKNSKTRDQSGWRTVSYPPMFSTIVEKVEEEEIEGRELDDLPSSPMTEFYYALTLKSRCVWPTFLGDWAFVNGHPYNNLKGSDKSDDEDEGYNDVDDDEVEDEDEDGIYDNFFIPNGYVCDKLKPQMSNKAHLAAKRSSRRGKADSKKQENDNKRIITKPDKMEDKLKLDKGKEINLQGQKGINNDESKSNKESKGNEKRVRLDKSKMEEKLERNGRDKDDSGKQKEAELREETSKFETTDTELERMVNGNLSQEDIWKVIEEEGNEQTKGHKFIWSAVERAHELLENKRKMKEERIKQEEEMRNEENERRKQEEIQRSLNEENAHKNSFAESRKDGKKDYAIEDDKHEIKKKRDHKEMYIQNDETRVRNIKMNFKDKHSDIEIKIDPKEKSTKFDDPLLWENGKNILQPFDKYADSKLESKQETATLPETLRIYKSNQYENTRLKEYNLTTLEVPKEKSWSTQNETENENTIRHDRFFGIRHAKSDNEIYNWRSATEPDTNYYYANSMRLSVEDGSNKNSLVKPRQINGSRVLKTSSSQNRLEELREQEVKRMEELKQEEFKRMEELRQEDKIAVGVHRRGLFNRGDVLARERTQIEELRRKEQFQREQLWQKEQKQLDELRSKEGRQIEELRRDNIVPERETVKEKESREEALKKYREQLRLRERFQKEELELKEIEHKVQLHLRELLHKEDLKEHEKNQLDELKRKEKRQTQDLRLNRQKVYGDLEKDEEEDELRKKKKREELLLQFKKEQLRKAQLRRQVEEESETIQNKKEDTKKQRESELDLKKEKDLRRKVHNQDYLFHDLRRSSEIRHVSDIKRPDECIFSDSTLGKSIPLNNSRTTISSTFSSNKADEHRFKPRRYRAEGDDYLKIQHSQEPMNTSRASFTNSLDRPKRRASENVQLLKEEAFLKRPTPVFDNYHNFMENVYSREETSRWQIPWANSATGITTRDIKANSALRYCETGPRCKASAAIQSPTSWSFASFFGMDESKETKPALRTHEELCKLARSIAEKRDQFRESLSKNSLAENATSALDTPEKNPSYLLGRESSKSQGNSVNKRVIDSSEETDKSKDNLNPNELKKLQGVPDSVKNNTCTDFLIKKNNREPITLDPSSIASRPFIRNSTRTVATRFYKRE